MRAGTILKGTKTLQGYLSLVLSLASFLSAILIPVWKYFASPEPFVADYQFEPITMPGGFLSRRQLPGANAAAQGLDRLLKNSTELLALKIQNNGPTARHEVSIRISFVHQFTGVGVTSTPSSIVDNSKWRDPVFREDQAALEFATLSEFPVSGVIQLSIWGQFDSVFHDVQVRSSEGSARAQEGTVVSGWPLFLVSNFWWISTLICVALAIVFLRSFELQRTP